MAVIVDGKKRIPFLRGMLAHYLLEQGLSFPEAYQVADKIRSEIQKRKTIQAKKMVELVHENVRELVGDRSVGDGLFWQPRPQNVLVGKGDELRPFSRERLAQSISVTGVDKDEAYRLAQRIFGKVAGNETSSVTRESIQKATFSALKEQYDKIYAERYRVLHEFRAEASLPLIVLIGGASGVGKTSVSVAVANRLKISRVASTDDIRQVMRLMIAPNLMPTLHASSYAAYEYVNAPVMEGTDPVLSAYREQATRVCVGVHGTVDRAIQENVSLIVDGVHLLPDVAGLDGFNEQALIVWANLFVNDVDQFSARFFRRDSEANDRSKHRYLKHMDQIIAIQEHILAVGEEHKIPAYENTDFDETVQSVCLQIIDTVRDRWQD